MKFYHRVREAAEEQGYSPSRLARRADISDKALRAIWADKAIDLRVSTLVKLAWALGVPPTDLIEIETPSFREVSPGVFVPLHREVAPGEFLPILNTDVDAA